MTQNVLIFNNQTVTPVQFILYLSRREVGNVASVVWQQMFAPPKVPAPVTWTDDWSAVFASLEDEIFSPIELRPTSVGRRWTIRTADGKQELVDSGDARPGYLEIRNDSGVITNPGVGLGGHGAEYIADVFSGATAVFGIGSPQYWIALPSLPMQNGQSIGEATFLLPPAQITSPVAVTVTLTGPPLVWAFSHSMADPAALLRAARELR
jgi:hypothetical protein